MEKKLAIALGVFVVAGLVVMMAKNSSRTLVFADVQTGNIAKSDSLMILLLFIGLVLFVVGGWLLLSSFFNKK